MPRIKKSKKKPSQYVYLRNVLREASIRWHPKTEARNRAKVSVQDGYFKNGNPRFRVKYLCAECERQGINVTWFEDETAMDHIIPCREPTDGDWDGNWTKYVNAMFCTADGYQCLCHQHHDEKTNREHLTRKLFTKPKK